MFIKSIKICGFKCFPDKETTIDFKIPNSFSGSGLNVLVGQNNSGKSTVFEAIDFLRNGADRDIDSLRNRTLPLGTEFYVEIEFVGKIRDVVTSFSEKKLDDYIEDVDEENQRMIAKRSSKFYSINQGKSEVDITPKKVTLLNFKNKQFENPSGIDAGFKKLFELDFIWADTNPDDITKFGSTTICGKLLSKIVKAFKDQKEYTIFTTAHHDAFNNPASGLKKELDTIEKRTQEVFKSQFGDVGIKFHFDQVDVESFFKNAKIKIGDGKTETYLDENGSGMQRSIALALLQVYAEQLIKHPDGLETKKPFYLFIDEPEICLHPQAQRKLLLALKEISKTQQVFITTHSPYFIDPDYIENVFKFNKIPNKVVITTLDTSGSFSGKEREILGLDVREIFFTDKILCVEGKTDTKRILRFLVNMDIDTLNITVIKMQGKGELKKYQKVLSVFGKEYKIILDLDAICSKKEHGTTLRSVSFEYEDSIKDKITSLGKTKREDLLFINLDENERKQKDEILKNLASKKIYIFSEGEIENYLDENGKPVAPEAERETELKTILSGF